MDDILAAESLFSLKNISYHYPGGQLALQNIDLTVNSGERLILLGANGSGKSTLLKLLDGLIFADQGEFLAFGQPITEDLLEEGEFAEMFRRRVAFVFQDSEIQLFSPTVFEELTFGPRQLDIEPEQAEQRARDLLEMLAITDLQDRQPHQLSGGQKKKVAIAGSLAINPDVLLLDEPTNNLDPRTQVWLFELLAELSQAGKTIILATQDLDFAARFAERVVVMDEEHQIVAEDTDVEKILADEKLLLAANLIHEHQSRYGKIVHHHPRSGRDHFHSDIQS